MLDVRQLQVLLAIQSTGSLSRASSELHLSVPTVAHHLDALEFSLATQLVDRSKRGSTLTAIGQAVAADAKRILGELDRTERMVADLRDAGLATLRLGTFPSIGSRLLPGAVRALQSSFRLRVEIVEGEPMSLLDALAADDIAAALVYDLASDPPLDSALFETTALFEEPFVIAIGKDHPLAGRDRLDFAELVEESWIISHHPDEASNRVLRGACHASGYEMRALLETDDLTMIHGFVNEGLGLALMTPSAINRDFDVLGLPATQPLGARRTSFVTRAGQRAPVLSALRDLLVGDTA